MAIVNERKEIIGSTVESRLSADFGRQNPNRLKIEFVDNRDSLLSNYSIIDFWVTWINRG
jgi:hypothetical protein